MISRELTFILMCLYGGKSHICLQMLERLFNLQLCSAPTRVLGFDLSSFARVANVTLKCLTISPISTQYMLHGLGFTCSEYHVPLYQNFLKLESKNSRNDSPFSMEAKLVEEWWNKGFVEFAESHWQVTYPLDWLYLQKENYLLLYWLVFSGRFQ